MVSQASNRRYGGLPAEDRREARRSRLIGAAILLYGRDGYRCTTVRAVCHEAGLTERYFYESFANSEALLAAAYEDVVTRLIASLRAAGGSDGVSTPERAARMLAAYFGAIRDHPAAARVFLIEIVGVSPTIDRAFETSLDRFAALVLDVYDPARRSLPAREPLLRRGVVGGLHQIAIAWLRTGCARPLDDVVAAAMPVCQLADAT